MNFELFPCIGFEPPLPEGYDDVGIGVRIAGRSLNDHLPDAACAKIKYQAEETGRYRVLCAERLRIMRLFEVHNVAATRWPYTIR